MDRYTLIFIFWLLFGSAAFGQVPATKALKLNADYTWNTVTQTELFDANPIRLTLDVTGTLAVGNGGTGVTTITGLVKGNGTSAMSAATAGTDYLTPSGSGAALTGFLPTFITQTASSLLANEQPLSVLATGLVKNTTTTGVLSIATAGTDYLLPSGSGAALTGITWSQIGSTPTTLAGYGITDSAPIAATYIVETASSGLSAEFALGSLATGILKNTTTTGVPSIAVAGTDYTSPTGTEALTNKTYNGNTWTAGTGTLTLAAGKTLTSSNTLTFAGTDSSTLNIGTGGTLGTNAYTSTAYLPLAGGTMVGNLIFTDNLYDIGATGATRPRTGYFGTSVVAPSFVGALTGNASTATSAATLTTTRAIYGNNFDGSAALTQIIASTYGGTGNGFAKLSGPTTTEKTWSGPDASATLLTDNAAVTVAQGGTGRVTGTTAYALVATGTTATGAQQTLASGATTEILVGGGASALPVWTTASGTGAPARVGSPAFTTPDIGVATGSVASIRTATEATDATCFPVFVTASGTQTLPPLTNTGLTFDSSTGVLGMPSIVVSGTAFTGTVSMSGINYLGLNGRGRFNSPTTDGVALLTNNGATDFNRLQLGGTTSSFPSIQRSSTSVVLRLADDSANAPLSCGNISCGFVSMSAGSNLNWGGRSNIFSPSDGEIRLVNSAGTGFTRLDFGVATNSAPAIGSDAVNGFNIQSAAGTFTFNDASTAGSGTVANRFIFGSTTAPTLTATNASVTDTIASTFYIPGAPTASTNTTIGTAYALFVDAGATRLDGDLTVGGATTATGLVITSAGIRGTTTNDSATTGNIGETVSAVVSSASPVGLTTATAANVTSVSLTAGDWDVSGGVGYTLTGATTTDFISCWNTTSVTLATNYYQTRDPFILTALTGSVNHPVTKRRLSISATTTVYLIARCTFTVGSVDAYGYIEARRSAHAK